MYSAVRNNVNDIHCARTHTALSSLMNFFIFFMCDVVSLFSFLWYDHRAFCKKLATFQEWKEAYFIILCHVMSDKNERGTWAKVCARKKFLFILPPVICFISFWEEKRNFHLFTRVINEHFMRIVATTNEALREIALIKETQWGDGFESHESYSQFPDSFVIVSLFMRTINTRNFWINSFHDNWTNKSY